MIKKNENFKLNISNQQLKIKNKKVNQKWKSISKNYSNYNLEKSKVIAQIISLASPKMNCYSLGSPKIQSKNDTKSKIISKFNRYSINSSMSIFSIFSSKLNKLSKSIPSNKTIEESKMSRNNYYFSNQIISNISSKVDQKFHAIKGLKEKTMINHSITTLSNQVNIISENSKSIEVVRLPIQKIEKMKETVLSNITYYDSPEDEEGGIKINTISNFKVSPNKFEEKNNSQPLSELVLSFDLSLNSKYVLFTSKKNSFSYKKIPNSPLNCKELEQKLLFSQIYHKPQISVLPQSLSTEKNNILKNTQENNNSRKENLTKTIIKLKDDSLWYNLGIIHMKSMLSEKETLLNNLKLQKQLKIEELRKEKSYYRILNRKLNHTLNVKS